MTKKTPIYNSINDVPVDHLQKKKITRSKNLMAGYDSSMSVEQFMSEIKDYDIKESTIELEKEYDYYDDVNIVLKLNYQELETDLEFNNRVKSYKKEQFDKYSLADYNKNVRTLQEKEAAEVALFHKLLKKYGDKV
jgi:hypothetical protein